MSLYDTISAQMKEALKAGEKERLLVFRGLKSAVDALVKNGQELSDELVLKTVQSEVKKRKEAIALYMQAGATDKAAAEEREAAILEPLLPAQLSEEEISTIIDQAISTMGATSPADMGKVMGQVSNALANKADMGQVSQLVRQKLSA